MEHVRAFGSFPELCLYILNFLLSDRNINVRCKYRQDNNGQHFDTDHDAQIECIFQEIHGLTTQRSVHS